ncbi:MAG: 23S rRNA (adenine(2030)-N(6))-methyltransferase RlmJ [Burkholderiales bacterium]|nr:23S rRNA (adenine(2030)-N(6))-methyltransferase RlmJ [Burkholderiales bacterium]
MFSYRHAFHAGNHADVLKHCIVVQLLEYLGQKDTPFWYIDTHAGAGGYALESEWAKKNAEYQSGITRLWGRQDLPPLLAEYVRLVREFNADGKLRYYPGSPFLALQLLRDTDRLRLFEMHGNENRALQDNFRPQGKSVARRTMFYEADGFASLKALLPPPPKRGLILIDPAYEDKQDYTRVVQTMQEALTRFPTGCYAIWYPQVQRRESTQLPERLKRLPLKSWLHASLTVHSPQAGGLGLHGSGMFIVNPPWTLRAALQEALPWLVKVLGQDKGAKYTLEGKQD